jgi:Kef-type K+ transport system membrane component KefB
MQRVGAAALLGATGGVILPFIGGTVIGKYVGGYGWYESIFIGTILTATSVSISAQTLLEMGQLRSKEGTTILGAAVIDDVMGIIVLSIVVAMHASSGGGEGAAPIWWVIVKMIGFFAVAIWVGDKLVPKFLRWASRWPGTETGFAMAIVAGLLFAFTAEAVGQVAAITGSYVAGVLIARHSDLGHQVAEKLGVLAYVTDELMADAGLALGQYLTNAAGDEIGWLVGEAILFGNGVGKPLGMFHAGNAAVVSASAYLNTISCCPAPDS